MLFLFSLLTILWAENVRALEGEGIIGGIPANPKELRYQVSLQLQGAHHCGGAIIDEQYVITAAHCVLLLHNEFMPFPLTVIAGTVDIKDGSGQHIRVASVYVPKKFNISEQPPTDDIAVLKLKNKLNLNANSNLSKLDLPPSTQSKLTSRNSFANVEALVSGFGWDQLEVIKVPIDEEGGEFIMTEGSAAGKLLKAKTLVIDNVECQQQNRNIIYDSQLCAKIVQHDENVDQGICTGDSGGPLVHENKLIGVVSYSTMYCNDAKLAAVYTRVSAYIDFINKAKDNVVTDDMRSVEM